MEAQHLVGLALSEKELSTSAVLAAAKFQCNFSNDEYEIHNNDTMQLLLRRADDAWILGTLTKAETSGLGPEELVVAIMLLPLLTKMNDSLFASLGDNEGAEFLAETGATLH